MISLDDVLAIHDTLIEKFGGSKGVRDLPSLESAINRPFQTFDSKDLYDTPIEKSAALIESLLINHPFIDGNKRTGYVLMRLLLLQSSLDIIATEDEKYSFVIEVAKGKLAFSEIVKYLNENVKSV